MKRASWMVLVMAITAALGACASEGRVEDGLEKALAARVGPAESYEVDVQGLRARAGEADFVRAEGVRVRPVGVPVLDRFVLEVRGARYDRGLQRLVAADEVLATVWVLPEDLAAFLEREQRIHSAAITLSEPDQMTVRFRPELGIPLLAEVTAELEGSVEGRGAELHFVVSEARAAGFRVGGAVTDRLTRYLNPVLDLSGLPLDVAVTSVRIEGGVLKVEATADVTLLGRAD